MTAAAQCSPGSAVPARLVPSPAGPSARCRSGSGGARLRETAHKSEREPKREEVEDLIIETAKIVKTLF